MRPRRREVAEGIGQTRAPRRILAGRSALPQSAAVREHRPVPMSNPTSQAAPLLAAYPELSPKAYEHPADRAATALLHRLPLFDELVKRLLDLTVERRMMQLLLGNSVRVGEDQLPELWGSHRAVCKSLDLPAVPPLHVIQSPVANAVTLGARHPVVLVQSSTVSMLDAHELQAVLAHEAGHVLSEHVRYRTTLELLMRMAVPRLPLLGQAPLRAVIMLLMAWYRAAELSCDRAAALALRDPQAVCSVLMKMAGGGLKGLSLDAFVRQADDYIEWDDLFDRHQRLRHELWTTHPFPVRRVHELTRWVKEGDYDRIVAGDYLRRGQEPPASEEVRSAIAHYTERFEELVHRTAGGVTRWSTQLRRWLGSFRQRAEEEGEGSEAEVDEEG